MDLGQRIRSIRKTKKMTLVELSKLTGVAQASLSRIETGIMSGTVESHQKIAEALGMSLAELYSGIDNKLNEIDYRQDDAIKKEAVVKDGDIQIELLVSQASLKKFAPFTITIPPGQSIVHDRSERGIDKFFWVQSGSICITLNNADYNLNANETIYFDASFSHIVKNTFSGTTKVLVVTSPSTV